MFFCSIDLVFIIFCVVVELLLFSFLKLSDFFLHAFNMLKSQLIIIVLFKKIIIVTHRKNTCTAIENQTSRCVLFTLRYCFFIFFFSWIKIVVVVLERGWNSLAFWSNNIHSHSSYGEYIDSSSSIPFRANSTLDFLFF